MAAMASQITSLTIVYSIVYSGGNQRKHQSSASLAFVRRIHRWPVNSTHKWPVTRKRFPFDDVIMWCTGTNLQPGHLHTHVDYLLSIVNQVTQKFTLNYMSLLRYVQTENKSPTEPVNTADLHQTFNTLGRDKKKMPFCRRYCIFNWNCCNSNTISLKCLPDGLIDNISVLGQMMAW